jgi:predicted hotdog family 3-hydroxylacyl-ACP dehydratase
MAAFPAAEDLLPHAAPMVLVDELVAHHGTGAVCEVTIREGAPFVTDGRVATLVTLEYMAQTVGVFAGYRSHSAGEPVQVGFLIGCRDMVCHRPWLPVGSVLRVRVERIWGDDMLGKFECGVELDDGTAVASATLNVARRPEGVSPM